MDLFLSRSSQLAGSSIQDRIRLALEEEILSGRRPPGSPIDEKALAQSYDASRTPVREALLMLAAQGLVHIAPRSGIFVRKATAGELVATLEALSELEAVVARLAARRATPEQQSELQTATVQCSRCAASNDRQGYEAANAVLHEAIYRASGNAVLVEHTRSVRRTLAAYRQRGFDKPGRLASSQSEHVAIITAICNGDDVAAAEAMRLHINVGADAMVSLVMASEGAPALAGSQSGRRRASTKRRS